ncbi:uncharacterized protein [Pagrus major]|uniref:uncharacterized protein n=1 Tax=Pagrus major TaxID=143350 RepID=UPI003CC8BD1B
MAEPGRTVRVSGLPTDTEDSRLKDKLFIHFLRDRNGGGEIDSVTIVKATPVYALITFEDSRVAQRVIRQRRHILEVDEKKCKVTVTEHSESLDPDKVIPRLSATVDYSQLPGGVMALTSLHKSHPDVQINYDATVDLYTLYGAYSKVQAALAQLFGPQPAENKDSGQPDTSGPRSVQVAQKPHTQEAEDKSREANKRGEQREEVHSDEYNSDSHRDLTPGGYGWEDTGQIEAAALQHPTTSEEEFFIMVDADMFQYVQKHCRKDYQQILSQHGVDVVDMTNQGLTSLFLQVATGVGDNSRCQETLKLAKQAMSSFFQENEIKIRRAQLPKIILSPRGGLQRAKDTLSVRLPKLLLNEDDRNIYIIGSSSDVSEAKQFLLLDQSEVRGKKEDVASLLRYPSYDSGSLTRADEQRVPLTTAPTVDPVDDRIDRLVRSEEDERRAEGARRYKLAARFKVTGLAALGSRPTDFSVRGGLLSPSRQARLGPVLGHDVLSETAQISGEKVSRAVSQNTGGDILFRGGDDLFSSHLMHKNSLNSHLTDARPKSLTSPLSTNQSSSSGSSPLPPAGSGSPLKRASSFSGTPQQRVQVTGQKSQDDSSRSTNRPRARSSSNSIRETGKDKREVHNAEITVPYVMWQHIKEAYSTRVDDLTSDVQVKERRSEVSSDLTVTLRGAESSKVSSCRLGLQRLVDSVSADFSTMQLHLLELGITDEADETLQACCADVRSRFKKVTIVIVKDSLFLLGPKQLCSQVRAALREVFSGDLAQIPDQQDFSSSASSSLNPSTFLQTNEDTSPHSNPQGIPASQTSKADWTGSSQERGTQSRSDLQESEHVNGTISKPAVRKEPVIKEKVRIVSTVEMDGQRTEINHSKTGNDNSARHVDGVMATTTRTDKDMALHTKEKRDRSQQRQTEIQDTPEESRPGLRAPAAICVCGDSEKLMTKTKCGATLCSKCLDTVHDHCKVCHETPRGIQGKISSSRIHISVPGHKKDSAIKITYCIPDGIQEVGHPSPGKPFQGGTFESYFPDCDKTRKLLPRLEKAFRQGLTFTVMEKETGGRVTWDCIPHKTTLHGGKPGNGYPDSTYLSRLSDVLTSHGIEEPKEI